MDKENKNKKEHPFRGGFYERYCIESMPKHLDPDILKRFTYISKAFKNEPIRRLPNL